MRGAGHTTRTLRMATNAIAAVLLAPHCASCRTLLDEPLAGPVCAACWSSVRPLPPPLCRACGDPLPSWRIVSRAVELCPRCRRRPPVVDAGASAGEYQGALRAILQAFKYDGRRSLAEPLGTLMRVSGADLIREVDYAIPVPLHPWRRLGRGFNQASDLAHQLHVPVVDALRRVRATIPQSGLSAASRQRNMRTAFRGPGQGWEFRKTPSLKNRVLVLVDDVRTTGATLDACARELKASGASEVRALTAARAAIRALR